MKEQDKQLFEAIGNCDAEGVKKAIAQGADVNSKNEFGLTPIECAILKQNGNIAEILAQSGAENTTVTDDLIIYSPENE